MQNPEMKAKIEEFEKIRYESQVLAIQKGEGDSEKMQKLQQLYTILVENKDIKEEWHKMKIKSFCAFFLILCGCG